MAYLCIMAWRVISIPPPHWYARHMLHLLFGLRTGDAVPMLYGHETRCKATRVRLCCPFDLIQLLLTLQETGGVLKSQLGSHLLSHHCGCRGLHSRLRKGVHNLRIFTRICVILIQSLADYKRVKMTLANEGGIAKRKPHHSARHSLNPFASRLGLGLLYRADNHPNGLKLETRAFGSFRVLPMRPPLPHFHRAVFVRIESVLASVCLSVYSHPLCSPVCDKAIQSAYVRTPVHLEPRHSSYLKQAPVWSFL